MKITIIIAIIALTLPALARQEPRTTVDQITGSYQGAQESVKNDYMETKQELRDTLTSYSLSGINRDWQASLDQLQQDFVIPATQAGAVNSRTGVVDNTTAIENTYQSRGDVAKAYNDAKENADKFISAMSAQIENITDNEAYKLIISQKATASPAQRQIIEQLEGKIASTRDSIERQKALWPEIGFFDSKRDITNMLGRAQDSAFNFAPLAQDTMASWQQLSSTYNDQIEAKREEARDNLIAHFSTYSNIDTDAFKLVLLQNLRTQDALDADKQIINKLSSDLLCKDIKAWATELGMDVGKMKQFFLEDKDFNEGMARTPMGIYVNRQISRAMAGICNEVAQCTEDAKSAQKAFTDMFKFLDDSSRGSNAIDAIPDDYEVDETVIKN